MASVLLQASSVLLRLWHDEILGAWYQGWNLTGLDRIMQTNSGNFKWFAKPVKITPFWPCPHPPITRALACLRKLAFPVVPHACLNFTPAWHPVSVKQVAEWVIPSTCSMYMLLSFMSEVVPQSKTLEYEVVRGNSLNLVSLVMACGPIVTPIKHVVKISFTDLPSARQKSVVFNTSCARYSHTFSLYGNNFGSMNAEVHFTYKNIQQMLYKNLTSPNLFPFLILPSIWFSFKRIFNIHSSVSGSFLSHRGGTFGIDSGVMLWSTTADFM